MRLRREEPLLTVPKDWLSYDRGRALVSLGDSGVALAHRGNISAVLGLVWTKGIDAGLGVLKGLRAWRPDSSVFDTAH
jgi:hypothetical protein